MEKIIAFLYFATFFCMCRIIQYLRILVPATYRTWHIVKYLKKSAMISYVVCEADKNGLFERYREFRIKDGNEYYVARKDDNGTIWLGNSEMSKVIFDQYKIEKMSDAIRYKINHEGDVLFSRFFLKQLTIIQRAVLASN